MPLHCTVFLNGEKAFEKHFDQGLVRIGRLDSAHLQLRDIARMHAFLEQGSDGGWAVVDLDSSLGTRLNGAVVDRRAELGKSGQIDFGPWTVRYEVVSGMGVPREEDSTHHHRRMMEALVAEMESRALHDAARLAKKMLVRWEHISDVHKRNALRVGVRAIREDRAGEERMLRQHVASMLRLGPEGIAEIYDLSPDDALAHARLTLHGISQATASIQMLRQLNLCAAIESAVSVGDPERQDSIDHFVSGHTRLLDLLEGDVVQGVSVLTACLSRAGGHTLTHRERVELKKAFEQIRNASDPS